MQGVVTVDTTEQQAFAGSVRFGDVPASGAALRGVIGIDARDHAPLQGGFIGQHALQFSKGPLRRDTVAFALLQRNTLYACAVLLPPVGTPLCAFSKAGPGAPACTSVHNFCPAS